METSSQGPESIKEDILQLFECSDSTTSDINYDIIAGDLSAQMFTFPPEVQFDSKLQRSGSKSKADLITPAGGMFTNPSPYFKASVPQALQFKRNKQIECTECFKLKYTNHKCMHSVPVKHRG
jgi:hypothetical protein